MNRTVMMTLFASMLFVNATHAYSPEFVRDTMAIRMMIDSCNPLDIRTIPSNTSVFRLIGDTSGGRVRSLNFKMTARYLHPIIGSLDSLETLDLGHNCFDSLPSALFTLKNLKWLSLNVSGPAGIKPMDSLSGAIGNLTNLKYLSLRGFFQDFGFSGPERLINLPEQIGNLENLEILDGGANLNITMLPEAFGKLKKLWWIVFDGCSLTKLPETIGNMESLEDLDFTFNQLTELPQSIARLKNATGFALSWNQISSLPDSIVNLHPSRFYIDSNNLCDLPCNIGNWMDQLFVGRDPWRITQRCAVIPVPPCTTNVAIRNRLILHAEGIQYKNKSAIYDLRGRNLGTTQANQLPANLRTGIYFLRSTGTSGRIVKQCVVK